MYLEDLELTTGACINCKELSDEIVVDDGRCLNCIKEEQEEEDHMNGIVGSDVYCPVCGAETPEECYCG